MRPRGHGCPCHVSEGFAIIIIIITPHGLSQARRDRSTAWRAEPRRELQHPQSATLGMHLVPKKSSAKSPNEPIDIPRGEHCPWEAAGLCRAHWKDSLSSRESQGAIPAAPQQQHVPSLGTSFSSFVHLSLIYEELGEMRAELSFLTHPLPPSRAQPASSPISHPA